MSVLMAVSNSTFMILPDDGRVRVRYEENYTGGVLHARTCAHINAAKQPGKQVTKKKKKVWSVLGHDMT